MHCVSLTHLQIFHPSPKIVCLIRFHGLSKTRLEKLPVLRFEPWSSRPTDKRLNQFYLGCFHLLTLLGFLIRQTCHFYWIVVLKKIPPLPSKGYDVILSDGMSELGNESVICPRDTGSNFSKDRKYFRILFVLHLNSNTLGVKSWAFLEIFLHIDKVILSITGHVATNP
jgi:hypothetical protein